MAGAACSYLVSEIFTWRAGIPDGQVCRTQAPQDIVQGSSGLFAQACLKQGLAGLGRLGEFLGERALVLGPGDQPAIEVGVALKADRVQQPEHATGPATAFVIIDHDPAVASEP